MSHPVYSLYLVLTDHIPILTSLPELVTLQQPRVSGGLREEVFRLEEQELVSAGNQRIGKKVISDDATR